ncbi:MAG: phytanoyl-CoA dioxygenase family protein [Gammaproteobacteria bacterium]
MSSGKLTPEQIEAFEHDGYLLCRGFFDPARTAEIQRWTGELQALPETPGRHMMYFEPSLRDGRRLLSRMENFYPFHAGFHALFDSDDLRGSVAQLFGEPAVLFKDKINFKLPGGDGFKAHQDVQAGWNTYASLHISVLVCIDEATAENGCLELVAGKHNHGLVGDLWRPLSDDEMAGSAYVSCPTLPGDVVFFDSFAPHRSGPNNTGKQRRMLYVTYNRASEGDSRAQYYADKRKSYPPDCEREPGKEYVFRV